MEVQCIPFESRTKKCTKMYFLKKVQKEIKELHFIFVYLRNKDVAEVSKNFLPQFKNASE